MGEEPDPAYTIEERGAGVEIHVTAAGDQQPMVMASLQDCQQGRCTCPTDQYEKVAAMHLDHTDHDVTVLLEPHAGQQFDVDQLHACLDYTLHNLDAS